MLKICVSFLTHFRESFSCSKKEISIGPHVWSIKLIKLGNYFFLKIDYCTNCEKKQQLRKKLNRNRSVWENMELLLTYISIMSSELIIHMELHSEFFRFMKGQKDKALQWGSCIEFVVSGQVQNWSTASGESVCGFYQEIFEAIPLKQYHLYGCG